MEHHMIHSSSPPRPHSPPTPEVPPPSKQKQKRLAMGLSRPAPSKGTVPSSGLAQMRRPPSTPSTSSRSVASANVVTPQPSRQQSRSRSRLSSSSPPVRSRVEDGGKGKASAVVMSDSDEWSELPSPSLWGITSGRPAGGITAIIESVLKNPARKETRHFDSPDPMNISAGPRKGTTSKARSSDTTKVKAKANSGKVHRSSSVVNASSSNVDIDSRQTGTGGRAFGRTTSAISVASTDMAHDSDADSESLAADADADATPKHNANANALRAMPSFKKKSEKVYEEGEFVAAANKAADHADARAFFKEVNDPTKLTAERTHAITRELRKQQEEEEEIEWAEERKHAEQLVDRQKKSRDAASFFAAAPSIRDKMFSRVKSEGDSILATLAFNAATPTPTKSSSLSNLGLSPVHDREQRYCADFIDSKSTCPYCGESLPKYPSPDLVTVRRRLEALGRGAKDWSKTSEHCGLHRAETSIIPLGWREKYPREIDFAKLDTRLEAGFVHTRLRHIVTKPDDSKFFRRAERCICIKGVRAWQTAAVQQEALSFATPGYYGEIGQKVIMHHFQCLLQWGHLPLATDAIQPLSASDFIMMVLVPEAATLLIMEDRGWTSAKCKGSAWKDARAVALEVRTDSAEYGRWRFRGESDAGQRIVETLADETRLEGKRARVAEHALALADKRSRKIKRSEHARDPIEIASSDIDISSSDTGSADPSDYGDDDEFWTSAMAVAGSTTPADLADVTPKAKTTKTTATTWPSTTATPTALQPLKRVPSDRTRPFEKGPSMFNANFARTESTESQESWDDGFTADALEQLSKHDAF